MLVGTYVWTMTYDIQNEKIVILDFNKEDPDGYINRDRLSVLQSIREDKDRVAQSVTFDNVEYEVENPQNVFTYKQPL